VLINNPDSVEIGAFQGLEALSHTFANGPNSTVFIINKCDESSSEDIQHIKKVTSAYFDKSPPIFEVSAKNWLKGSGDQYDLADLLGHLTYLTARRFVVLVLALLERLITNINTWAHWTSVRSIVTLSGSLMNRVVDCR
jgi:hypothetical protein